MTVIIVVLTICMCFESQPDKPKLNNSLYNFINMTLFAITGFSATLLLSMLIYIISKHFKKDLNLERRQLVICQSIFVSGFVVRVILIFCVYQGLWTDFVRDYPNEMKVPLCLPLQFIFYNFLPYMTLIYLHWRNFEPKKVEAEDYDEVTSSSKKV